MNAKNDDDNTVLDLLVDLPSERSQEITALIYGKFYFCKLKACFGGRDYRRNFPVESDP